MAAPAVDLATEAGLRYVSDEEPGIRRLKRGKGFSFVRSDGSIVEGAARERVRSLAIPPAWTEVWIAPDEDAHILATGYDDAGRKQYIYHPRWEEVRDQAKFDRLRRFGGVIGHLRRQVDSDLRQNGLERSKVVALAVAVLDRTLIRVGNQQYADTNESYGLTTLTTDHVEVNGAHVRLSFAGKGGADQQLAFSDRRLARLIADCEELGGQTLFSYESGGGTSTIGSSEVNAYLAEITGQDCTSKDFRTWGATSIVVGELAQEGPEAGEAETAFSRAVDVAAEKLGNSREVCRDSYVHPIARDAHLSGALASAWRHTRRGKWVSRSESALNLLLSNES